MREVLRNLMDSAASRAEYADVRHVRLRNEAIGMRNGELDELDSHEEEGIGVRVRLDGRWGFAAAAGSSPGDAEQALYRALAIADAQPRGAGVALAAVEPIEGTKLYGRRFATGTVCPPLRAGAVKFSGSAASGT